MALVCSTNFTVLHVVARHDSKYVYLFTMLFKRYFTLMQHSCWDHISPTPQTGYALVFQLTHR